MNKSLFTNSLSRLQIATRFWALCLCFWVTGCAEKKTENQQSNNIDNQTIDAYYAAHADFFKISDLNHLPKALIWQTGLDEPEFANIHAPKGGTLHLAIADFPRTLRPVGPDSNSGLRGALYDTNTLSLVDTHPNTLAYIPALASSWALGDDQKTVYFKINPKACYSDGTPIRTGDFFYTFYFMCSPHIQSPFSNNWYTETYESITYYDDFTFSVTLKNKTLDPVWYGNLAPTPRHYYGELTPDYPRRYQWSFPPTTGPYELKPENMIKGRKVTLSHVENWWAQDERYYRGRYNVDNITYRTVRDVSSAFERFKKGEIDIIDLTLPEYWYKKSQIPAVKNGYIERAIFYNQVPRSPAGIYLNEQAGILKDVNVRRGIAYALNLDQVIETCFHGDYKRLSSCAEGYGLFTNTTIPLTPFSPEKAEAAFALAGFNKKGKDGILINEAGKRLSFTLTINNGPLQEMYTLLQNEADKAGVEIILESLDPLTVYGKVMSKKHEAVAWAWGGGFSRKPESYWQFFHSKNALPGTNNLTNTADPELDVLIDNYTTTESETVAQSLSCQIQEKVAARYAYLPTWYCPYYRVGYWRWLCFPEAFNVMISDNALDYGLYWIDENKKTETKKAQAMGIPFPEKPSTYGTAELSTISKTNG